MKRITTLINSTTWIVAILTIIICVSYRPDNKKTLANVKQDNGLYVFIESTPANEYETLGTVKKSIALTGSAREMVRKLCSRAKDDYPQAEGIIFDDLSLDHATVIKFK